MALKTPQQLRDEFEATKRLVAQDQIERMHVLWKKGRNMLASFFVELDMARRQINDETAFATWCFYHLGIGTIRLNEVAVALKPDDAALVRNDLTAAVRAEKDRKAAEDHARKLEKVERDNELARKRAENVERKAAKAAEAKKAKKAEKAAANKLRKAEKAAREGDLLTRAKREILADPAATRDQICRRADVSPIVYARAVGELIGEGKIAPKDAANDQALYEQYVTEGRAAANHQWTLGDLAINVSMLKVHGGKTLEHFAQDIVVEYASLREYRRIAEAWPQNARHLAFSIAQILAAHPDRFAIVKRDPHMTCEEAREIMRAYKASSNIVPIRETR